MGTRLLRRNPLAYPGTLPGFDQTHPAAKGISAGHGLSATIFGGTLFNLLTGVAGSASSMTPGIFGPIGSAIQFGGTGSDVTFSGQSTVAEQGVTFGAIIQTPAALTGGGIVSNSLSAGGSNLEFITAGNLSIRSQGHGAATSTMTPLKVNTPFFIAASYLPSATVNFVATNLATGQIFSESDVTSLVNQTAPGGTYSCGQAPAISAAVSTYIAAAMFAPSYTPLSVLQLWAADPWTFWYPDKLGFNVSSFGFSSFPPPPPATGGLIAYATPRMGGPFRRPQGKPSLNLQHPAAQSCNIAVMVDGVSTNNFPQSWNLPATELVSVNIAVIPRSGLFGNPNAFNFNGTVTSSMDPALGAVFNLGGFANIHGQDTIGKGSIWGSSSNNIPNAESGWYLDHQATGAIICKIPNVPNGVPFFRNGAAFTNNAGLTLNCSGGNLVLQKNFQNSTNGAAATTINSGIPFPAGVPVFIAFSSDDTLGVNFVLVRLDNGRRFSSFVADTHAVSYFTRGIYEVDASGGGTLVAGWSWSSVALTMPQLLHWAADPWSLWYGRSALDVMPNNAVSNGFTPPVTGQFTVSGPDVIDLFDPPTGVVYTWAPTQRRTV